MTRDYFCADERFQSGALFVWKQMLCDFFFFKYPNIIAQVYYFQLSELYHLYIKNAFLISDFDGTPVNLELLYSFDEVALVAPQQVSQAGSSESVET